VKFWYRGGGTVVLAAITDKKIQHAVPTVGAAGEYRASDAETVDQRQGEPHLFRAVARHGLGFVDHHMGSLCLVH
jgi:hypothetical protein